MVSTSCCILETGKGSGHFPMVVESEIHMRSSDHGDLSGNKFLTKGSCPSIVYFIDRTNPSNGHWIWALLSMTMGKYHGCIYVEQILNERQ